VFFSARARRKPGSGTTLEHRAGRGSDARGAVSSFSSWLKDYLVVSKLGLNYFLEITHNTSGDVCGPVSAGSIVN